MGATRLLSNLTNWNLRLKQSNFSVSVATATLTVNVIAARSAHEENPSRTRGDNGRGAGVQTEAKDKSGEAPSTEKAEGKVKTVLSNGKAYDRASTGPSFSLFSPEHCCVCGKETRKGSEWLLLTRDVSGSQEYAISHPSDATIEEIRSSLWVAPIGPDCLRKHPELRHAMLERKV
jgi:hypothetical protein